MGVFEAVKGKISSFFGASSSIADPFRDLLKKFAHEPIYPIAPFREYFTNLCPEKPSNANLNQVSPPIIIFFPFPLVSNLKFSSPRS
jgi:hypothetical protein